MEGKHGRTVRGISIHVKCKSRGGLIVLVLIAHGYKVVFVPLRVFAIVLVVLVLLYIVVGTW